MATGTSLKLETLKNNGNLSVDKATQIEKENSLETEKALSGLVVGCQVFPEKETQTEEWEEAGGGKKESLRFSFKKGKEIGGREVVV